MGINGGVYRVMTPGGLYGPEWRCDDEDEAVALAEEHGYDVLDTQEDRDGATILVVAE